MARVKMSDAQVVEQIVQFPGWSVVDGKISKTFEFSAYASGLAFAVAVGHLADRMDHHPDLTIGYQRVTVAVNTHDVGGISPVDFELARQIDSIA